MESKSRFFFTNLLKGLAWLALILGGFILVKKLSLFDFDTLISSLYHKPFLIYTIYALSELIFGIIPPEIFMLWALGSGSVPEYALHVTLLALISFLAGLAGYYFGNKFSNTKIYRKISKRYLEKYGDDIRRFGGLLVVVGAFTPVPYSATCMLAGAVKMPFNRFVLYAMTRFARYAVYAWLVWEANMI